MNYFKILIVKDRKMYDSKIGRAPWLQSSHDPRSFMVDWPFLAAKKIENIDREGGRRFFAPPPFWDNFLGISQKASIFINIRPTPTLVSPPPSFEFLCTPFIEKISESSSVIQAEHDIKFCQIDLLQSLERKLISRHALSI